MRTPTLLLAALALALGPAATASAKEIASVKACGTDGCRDVTALATHASLEGGPPALAPDRAAPFFQLKIRIRAEGQVVPGWTLLYVPSAGKVQADDGTWMNPASSTLDELDRLVRDVSPMPASKLEPLLPEPEPVAAAAPAAPSPPVEDDGLPAAVWVLLAVGVAGVLAAGARGVRVLVTRWRGGAAPAG